MRIMRGTRRMGGMRDLLNFPRHPHWTARGIPEGHDGHGGHSGDSPGSLMPFLRVPHVPQPPHAPHASRIPQDFPSESAA
jgi:hypothetical protein